MKRLSLFSDLNLLQKVKGLPVWVKTRLTGSPHQGRWGRAEKRRHIEAIFAYINYEKIPGDYLEFGVLDGRTFAEAWRARKRYSLPMRLHAFDSFQGLPADAARDENWPQGLCVVSRPIFDRMLWRNRVDRSRITITEGWFDATLNDDTARAIGLNKIAIAWIDGDLYASAVPVLRFITPFLADGAIIVFDDWFHFHGRPTHGEQRACSEWLAANPGFSLTPYRQFGMGQSSIVHRPDGDWTVAE